MICQGQLDSVVPLEPATMPGRVVVQWDKDDCADMGIVKVDLLGLGMMAVLEDSLKIIREDHWRRRGSGAICRPTIRRFIKTLRKADTMGMFQMESRAQMAVCRGCSRSVFTTLWCKWRLFGRGRLWGKW